MHHHFIGIIIILNFKIAQFDGENNNNNKNNNNNNNKLVDNEALLYAHRYLV